MSGFNNDISNTGGPGSSAEPSMEEILASIRRILREDDRPAPAPVEIDDDVLVLDETMLARSPDLASATVMPPATALQDDVISAHPEARVTSYHNEMHLASEPAPMTAAFAAGEVFPSALEEALFAAPEERGLSEMAPSEATPPLLGNDPEPTKPEPAATPEFAQTYFTPRQSAAPEPDMQEFQPPDGLVGDEAASAAKSSIGALVRSISQERAVAVSRGGVTIEDIVREEIRPMLKSWLDTHLPALVERIVRAEIERVVDRTQL
jgi:cell pole-organizing protein PopZ